MVVENAVKVRIKKICVLLAVAMLLMASPRPVAAYSVLSHEAIIDSAWDTSIKPVLLKRFPDATKDELREAHGYAYGGAIIQDMGYYPHGSMFFSDLAHYVRSGDFVLTMLRDSKDLNEYAFALGALAHYAADTDGHRLGTNRAVRCCIPSSKRSTVIPSPTKTIHSPTSRRNSDLMFWKWPKSATRPTAITISSAFK